MIKKVLLIILLIFSIGLIIIATYNMFIILSTLFFITGIVLGSIFTIWVFWRLILDRLKNRKL